MDTGKIRDMNGTQVSNKYHKAMGQEVITLSLPHLLKERFSAHFIVTFFRSLRGAASGSV